MTLVRPSQGAVLRTGFNLLVLRPDRLGGLGTYVRNLLVEFTRLDDQAVTVLANSNNVAWCKSVTRNLRIVEARHARSGDTQWSRSMTLLLTAAFPRLVTVGLQRDFDVMHYPATAPVPAMPGARVLTLHDVLHLDHPQFFSFAERAYRGWAYDRAARSGDLVVTVSQHARTRLIDRLGLDPRRVEVVYHGTASGRRADPSPQDAARLRDLGILRPFILYPANLLPHKNHGRLLQAFSMIKGAKLDLVLTGHPQGELDRLAELAQSLQIRDRVRYLGFVSDGDVSLLFRRARACVFPSLYEGFGLPPLEAMDHDCPVACSRAASLPEVCGDAAVFFNPTDIEEMALTIERVVSDEQLREQLIARGQTRLERFTWRASARNHLAVYRRAASMAQGGLLETPASSDTAAVST